MTMKIPLTRGLFALVDEADYPHLIKFKWRAGPVRSLGKIYAFRSRLSGEVNVKNISMHREIMGHDGPHVDHKNHDGLDNRRENLRHCTRAQNGANARRKNKYGLRGVVKLGTRYRGCLYVKGKRLNCNSYKSPVIAAFDYDRMARENYGEFATLNFPCVDDFPKIREPFTCL